DVGGGRGGDGLVGLAEVEEHGAARLLRRRLGYTAAVVRDRAGHAVDAGGGEPRQRAAQAVTDHAHLEPLTLEGADGGADVLDHVHDVDLAADGAAAIDVLRGIAALEAVLGAIEDGGGQRHVPVGGEAVRHLLDVGVDAEDLLNDDDAGLWLAGGSGAIGAERMTILSLERDHLTHAGSSGAALGRSPLWGGRTSRRQSYL